MDSALDLEYFVHSEYDETKAVKEFKRSRRKFPPCNIA